MASVANDHEAPTSADLSFSGREDPSENSSSMAVDGGKSDPPRADLKGRVFKLDSSRGEGRVLENRGAVEASWMNEFMEGDMVWGKVKSHPWWPGYIYTEAFATPSVRELKKRGMRWSRSLAIKLTAGSSLRRLAGGEPYVWRSDAEKTFVLLLFQDYFAVDLLGFKPEEKYSCYRSRRQETVMFQLRHYHFCRFQLRLFFLQNLALSSQENKSSKSGRFKIYPCSLHFTRLCSEYFDPIYPEAFGVNPIRPSKDQSDRINATRAQS